MTTNTTSTTTSPKPLLFRSDPPRFLARLKELELDDLSRRGADATDDEARRALSESPLSLDSAAILLASRGGVPLDDLVARARQVTEANFGRSVGLYAPCYLSSHCVGYCRYCGFRYPMTIPRRFLSPAEAADELSILARRGLSRVLLVAGDYPSLVTPDYVAEVVRRARRLVPEVDLELAPVRQDVYEGWREAGADGLTCYQETYNPCAYAELHPKGPKSYYEFRLGAVERAGRAGMRRLGLGVLLDLATPVPDVLALIAHGRFLEERFPAARIAISLPRLRRAVPDFSPACLVDADSLVRFTAALRIALPAAVLVGSTREPPELRERLLGAGVTQMSAGSVTVPGGYREHIEKGGQFEIQDHRGVEEIRSHLERLGYAVR